MKHAKTTATGRTHIAVVLDRSGSMENIAHDMVGGLKSFVKEQQAVEGACTFTLAQFDDVYDVIYDHVDLTSVKELSLVPRGSTALLDAIGRTLTNARSYVAGLPAAMHPTHKLICIITDGMENASREWSKEAIVELVEKMEAEGWVISYLGANQDAIKVGASMGFQQNNTMTYHATRAGAQSMTTSYAVNTTMLRSTGHTDGFSEAQREDAVSTGGSSPDAA